MKPHTLVVDPTVVLALLLRPEEQEEAVVDRILDKVVTLASPHLLDIEVAEALWRARAAGELTPARAERAVRDLEALPIHRWGHQAFLGIMWRGRDQRPMAESAYLALARFLAAPLVTLDPRLRGVEGVEVLA